MPLIVISHGVSHRYDAYDYLEHHLASNGFVVMSLQNTAETTDASPSEIADQVLVHVDAFLKTISDPNCSSHLDTTQTCDSVEHKSVCELRNQIDPRRVVLLGHSRGGNAVVVAYDRLDPHSPDWFESPFVSQPSIALIGSMAPTDFQMERLPDSRTAPYVLMWMSGDSDVTGEPNPHEDHKQTLAFQLLERAHGDKQSLYIHGGNHGWFHERCPAGNAIDCKISGRPPFPLFSQPEVHELVQGYLLAVLKVYLEANVPGQDFLWRSWDDPDLAIGGGNIIAAKEHEFGTDTARVPLDDYELNFEDPRVNSSGGKVIFNVPVFEGEMADEDCHLDWERSTEIQTSLPVFPACSFAGGNGCDSGTGSADTTSTIPCEFDDGCPFIGGQPMNGMTRSRVNGTSRGARVEWAPPEPWEETRFYEEDWKEPVRVAPGQYLSFRAAQMPRHPKTMARPPTDLDFKVVLLDRDGRSAGICLNAGNAGIMEPFSRAGPNRVSLYKTTCRRVDNQNRRCCDPASCNPLLSDVGWQAEFETVRMRLGDFLTDGSGLDLNFLAAVRFEFGTCDAASTEGAITIDDIEVTSAALSHPPPAPCPSVTPCNGVSCLRGDELAAVSTGVSDCQPATGPPIHCGIGKGMYVVTRRCSRARCCDQAPFCFCPPTCSEGTYLECR